MVLAKENKDSFFSIYIIIMKGEYDSRVGNDCECFGKPAVQRSAVI